MSGYQVSIRRKHPTPAVVRLDGAVVAVFTSMGAYRKSPFFAGRVQ